jgi:hypothetical protein
MCKSAETVIKYSQAAISPKAEEYGERVFAKAHAKRKLRHGKKIVDMNKEELHAYWREAATARRKRLLDKKQDLTPAGEKVMKGLQRNADTIKKIKEEFPNEVSERP